MSRYALTTDKPGIEVFVGLDPGFHAFFLTVEQFDPPESQEGVFLFHNLDHHPQLAMSLRDVKETLFWFGLNLPEDLEATLAGEAEDAGVGEIESFPDRPRPRRVPQAIRVLNWQSAL